MWLALVEVKPSAEKNTELSIVAICFNWVNNYNAISYAF